MGPYDGLSTPWWESCVTATGRASLQQSGTEPISRHYGAALISWAQHLERMHVRGSPRSEPTIVIFCRVEAMVHSVGSDASPARHALSRCGTRRNTDPTSVGLTVARTHLPLGPRWGITLLLCAPGGASPTPQQSPGGASLPGAGIARASW